MMTKDNETRDVIAATVARAGADSAKFSDRMGYVEARSGETKVTLPYVITGDGRLQVCQEAVSAADTERKRASPDRTGIYDMDDMPSLVAWGKRYATDDTAA